MDAISRVWYNGLYTIAAKPIKTLEMHYTMIQFLIMKVICCFVFFFQQRALRAEATVAKLKEEVNILKVILWLCDTFSILFLKESIKNSCTLSLILSLIYKVREN